MAFCRHCDEMILAAFYNEDDGSKIHPFCCYGCLTVNNIIHLKGFETYYEIKDHSGSYKRRSPVAVKSIQYKYLDDAECLTEYSYLNIYGGRTMEFYLEGIHCLACLWLIEKLPEILPSVLSSKLDLDRSVVTVVLKDDGKYSEVAREFNNLGYRPHPLKINQDAANLKIKEERSALIRIGVAGAAAGNIMIYAVSLYGGASDLYGHIFNTLTVIFGIPVLTYSAFPFYQNAWNALRNRTLSIDIPISLALMVGGIMGIYNLMVGVTENYYDSLTTLVFLLLLSRYFLQKIQQKGLSSQDLHFFYNSESVLKADNFEASSFVEIHPKFIKVNDILKIRSGDFVPADGVIIQGTSSLNNSLLTGESLPVKATVGNRVFSGTQNLDAELIIQVEKTQNDTKLGNILKNVENGWSHHSKIVDLTSKVSKYFTFVVFALSLFLFLHLYIKGETQYALEQALTLLIVTCPCALALATPITLTRALTQASKHGIIIKSDEVIERLAKIKNIFLDKTGTITHGKLQITDFEILHDPFLPTEEIIFNLEGRSGHPVAMALLESIKNKKCSSYPVTDYKEIFGEGVSGSIHGHFYEIRRNGIFENGLKVANFDVEDTVRTDSSKALSDLLDHGMTIKILSGDKAEVVQKIASAIDLPLSHALAQLSPMEKSELIKSTPHSMMVGDGANDAIALSNAYVGVAVFGAMDISLRAADVYLTTPGLVPVEKLITLSKETMKVIYRNLFLSLIYNSVSVSAAFMGLISPLNAAIIMPLSSLTVLVSTLWGTKKLRYLWK